MAVTTETKLQTDLRIRAAPGGSLVKGVGGSGGGGDSKRTRRLLRHIGDVNKVGGGQRRSVCRARVPVGPFTLRREVSPVLF